MGIDYQWYEVTKEEYDTDAPVFINNKACLRILDDGASFVDVSAANISPGEMAKLTLIFKKLIED